MGKQKGITAGTAVLIIAVVAAAMGGGLYLIFHYKSTEEDNYINPIENVPERIKGKGKISLPFLGSAKQAYEEGYVEGVIIISPSKKRLRMENGRVTVETNFEYFGRENAPETVTVKMTDETEIYTSWKPLENGKFPENARVVVNEILSMEPETIELKKGENIQIDVEISIVEDLPRGKLKMSGHEDVPVPFGNYRSDSDEVETVTDEYVRLIL
ncbi:hypothetical protein AKJ38_02905 [candidate division MSBL1 archaeon SCGC-AAA259I14]|uniref:Uncharacterized protein n=1 Tax=candidate division MSBL1 archaeon SCGC-AAA259I14 TaxID=1698268 RepID=A0A133UQX4_9EURY|nr:hypothetical protein AKJ38_02905 [candidate division MSBL1 archaeon SCGC-AAA259I14]